MHKKKVKPSTVNEFRQYDAEYEWAKWASHRGPPRGETQAEHETKAHVRGHISALSAAEEAGGGFTVRGADSPLKIKWKTNKERVMKGGRVAVDDRFTACSPPTSIW